MTKYYSRIFEFTGLGAELVKLLDVYQYMICLATQDLEIPRRERYIKLRIGAIGLITSLHGILVAFASDPDGQKERLDEAVRVMQNFMGRVAQYSLQFLAPSRKRKAKGKRVTVRESLEPVLRGGRTEGLPMVDKAVAPRAKGARALHPATLVMLVRAKAMSDALDFACLEKSEVNQLAKDLAKGHPT